MYSDVEMSLNSRYSRVFLFRDCVVGLIFGMYKNVEVTNLFVFGLELYISIV